MIFAFLFLFGFATAQACPFSDGRFTDVDPQKFAQQIVWGKAMHESDIRLFKLLPEKQKKLVLEKVFAEETQTLAQRPKDRTFPFDPKFSINGYAKLMMRDAFARDFIPTLNESLGAKQVLKDYVGAEIEYAKKNARTSLSLAQIQELTKEQKTITAWLADLPKSFRGQYTAISNSGALQSGTVAHPRIIYFDDETIIGVNGDPRQTQFQVAEVMKLDPVKASTHLYTVSEQVNAPVKLSDDNLSRCKKCHGEKDNSFGQFSAYSFWEGAVGSFRDTVPTGSPEETALGNLRRMHEENHPRYGQLENFAEYSTIDPTTGQLAQKPNEKLNHVLNLHAMTRMFRLIVQSPNYCVYRYAIFAALSGCRPIEDYVPKNLRNTMKGRAEYLAHTEKLKEKLQAKFLQIHPKVAASDSVFKPEAFFDVEQIADLRFLFQGRGLSMRGWSTDTITGYGWSDGENTLGFLMSLMAFGDRGLTDYYRVTNPDEKACADLKKKSLDSLALIVPPTTPIQPILEELRPRH